jgi:hypothetical protein
MAGTEQLQVGHNGQLAGRIHKVSVEEAGAERTQMVFVEHVVVQFWYSEAEESECGAQSWDMLG